MRRRSLPAVLATLATLACDATGRGSEVEADTAMVVDSALPMPVLLDRFRADLPDPGRLLHGAGTRDALVEGVVRALERADTAALEAFALDRAEFAWLYFPSAPVAHPPYELPPGIAWLQAQQRSRSGVLRALRELGGRELGYRGHRCAPEPQLQGENRLWTDCRVTLAPDGSPVEVALFGAVLERDGRFAIVSYANDF